MGDGSPSLESAAIVARLEALGGRDHVPAAYVGFRIAVFRAQAAVCAALAGAAPPPPASAGPDGAPRREGPVVGPQDLAFDPALLARLLAAVAAAARSHGAGGHDLDRLAAAAARAPGLPEELARWAALERDDARLAACARRLDVAPATLLLCGRLLAAPFVADAVRRHKGRRGASAPRGPGRCPYCGAAPGLAKLRRGDGRRILFCSLCGEGWEFARVGCPFCGGGQGLEMLTAGRDAPRWIETCGHCRRYLKTTDERKLPDGEAVIPLVEATQTLYLDLIAEEEGCAPAPPYAALR